MGETTKVRLTGNLATWLMGRELGGILPRAIDLTMEDGENIHNVPLIGTFRGQSNGYFVELPANQARKKIVRISE